MSDTRRYVHPIWVPGAVIQGVETLSYKHLMRDRPSANGLKNWRFSRYVKNVRYNLLRKIEGLKMEEALEAS